MFSLLFFELALKCYCKRLLWFINYLFTQLIKSMEVLLYIVRVNIRWHRSNYIVKSDKNNSFEKYGVYQILYCNKFNATEIYQEIIEIHGDDDWQNIMWPSVLAKKFKFSTVVIQPAIVTVQFKYRKCGWRQRLFITFSLNSLELTVSFWPK